MLLVRVFVDAGLVVPFDPRPYPPDWHLHRSEERYLGFVADLCAECDTAQPGDVVLFRFGRCWAHGGIATVPAPLTIVHAFSPAGCVLEEPVAANSLLADPRRAWRIFTPFKGR